MRPGGICNRTFHGYRRDGPFVIVCNNKDICRKHRAASPGRHALAEPEARSCHSYPPGRREPRFLSSPFPAPGFGRSAPWMRGPIRRPWTTAPPCAEGRALFAAKLAYLEAHISPEPSQEEAWRTFADAMRASAGEVDRACVEDPPRPISADAGERLKHMERHAAAMQAMFGAMANAYVAIAPNLTTAQRDILSRNIVPSPPIPSFPRRRPADLGCRLALDMALDCGQGRPESHDWGPPGERRRSDPRIPVPFR